jgi:hypothetical protein
MRIGLLLLLVPLDSSTRCYYITFFYVLIAVVSGDQLSISLQREGRCRNFCFSYPEGQRQAMLVIPKDLKFKGPKHRWRAAIGWLEERGVWGRVPPHLSKLLEIRVSSLASCSGLMTGGGDAVGLVLCRAVVTLHAR